MESIVMSGSLKPKQPVFARTIRLALVDRSWIASDLARALSAGLGRPVNRSYIARVVAGKATPTMHNPIVREIAKILGIDLRALTGYDEEATDAGAEDE
jgi:ribosome-binding protein aMBF1 (putative translation factor)